MNDVERTKQGADQTRSTLFASYTGANEADTLQADTHSPAQTEALAPQLRRYPTYPHHVPSNQGRLCNSSKPIKSGLELPCYDYKAFLRKSD